MESYHKIIATTCQRYTLRCTLIDFFSKIKWQI